MADPTLIADLVRAGLAAELVGRVAKALEVVAVETMSRTVPDNVPDISRDTVRKYERERKRKLRKSTGKQTMSVGFKRNNVPDNVPDKPLLHCDSLTSSFLSSEDSLSDSQRRKEEKSSRRGSRMVPDMPMPDDFREFAAKEGFDGVAISRIWLEFVDFWIAVPGQRGVKLDWLATWRNRVRAVKAHNGTHARKGNGAGNSLMAAFDDLIARTTGGKIDRSPPMVDITPRRSESGQGPS